MNKKINTSSDRGSFRKNNQLKKLVDSGIEPSDDEYFTMLLSFDQQKREREQDPSWQKNNLEYDLRTTEWVIDKVNSSDTYAQNLYAALCNNQFIQLENSWDILKENYWHCSWRYAGGIIADIQEKGDYIDWYCSGINGDNTRTLAYVGEGFITEEIKNDLKKLGWVVIPDKDDDYI